MKLFIYLFGLVLLSSMQVRAADSCPAPNFAIKEPILIPKDDDQEGFVDQSRDIKNFGTDIVVKSFFKTPDTLFNFLKLVYGNLDKTVSTYRQSQGLAEDAIFLVFKGGNGLRMIANTVFDELPPIARDLLKEKYSGDFTRSDADFSVYINEKKLNTLNYDKVFNEVTTMLFSELDKIRAEFKANPAKYFNFFQFDKDFASGVLNDYLTELNKKDFIKDETNEVWHNAKFKQLQLRDMKANKDLNCNYEGNFDYRFEIEGKNIVGKNASSTTNWIGNSDNRALEFPFGKSADKVVKFSLVRSKVMFEYTYEKEGILQRRPIGGELIDVSLPHRKDASLAEFLDTPSNLANFSVVSGSGDDRFEMKAYSVIGLAHDLHKIMFDVYDRPWDGPKYTKRLNRLMFFITTEMIGNYGLGSQGAKDYVAQIQEQVLQPLATLYPLTEQSAKIVDAVLASIAAIKNSNPQMRIANDFFDSLGILLNKLIKNPLEKDAEELKTFLESIQSSMAIASEMAAMPDFKPVDINKINELNISKIF